MIDGGMRVYPASYYKNYQELYSYLERARKHCKIPTYLDPEYLVPSIFKLLDTQYVYNLYIRIHGFTIKILDNNIDKALSMYLPRKVKAFIIHLLYLQRIIDIDYATILADKLGIKYERIRHYTGRIIPFSDRGILQNLSKRWGRLFYLTGTGAITSHAVSSAIVEHYCRKEYGVKGIGGFLIGFLTGYIIGDGGINTRRNHSGIGFRNYIYDYKNSVIKILDLLAQTKVISYKQYHNRKFTLYSRIYRVWPHNHLLYRDLRRTDKTGFITGLLLSDGYIYKDNIHATIYQAITLRKAYMLPAIKEIIHTASNMISDIGGKYSLTIKLKKAKNPTTQRTEKTIMFALNFKLIDVFEEYLDILNWFIAYNSENQYDSS